jgi:hypothetical protein
VDEEQQSPAPEPTPEEQDAAMAEQILQTAREYVCGELAEYDVDPNTLEQLTAELAKNMIAAARLSNRVVEQSAALTQFAPDMAALAQKCQTNLADLIDAHTKPNEDTPIIMKENAHRKQELAVRAFIGRCPRCGVPSPHFLDQRVGTLCGDCLKDLQVRDGVPWFARTVHALHEQAKEKVEKDKELGVDPEATEH